MCWQFTDLFVSVWCSFCCVACLVSGVRLLKGMAFVFCHLVNSVHICSLPLASDLARLDREALEVRPRPHTAALRVVSLQKAVEMQMQNANEQRYKVNGSLGRGEESELGIAGGMDRT